VRLFHFLSARHALQAINKQRIKIAKYSEMNDPFELMAKKPLNANDEASAKG